MEVCVRFDGEPGIGDPGRRELVRMMSRITSLRWIAALLLLMILVTGMAPAVSASEKLRPRTRGIRSVSKYPGVT